MKKIAVFLFFAAFLIGKTDAQNRLRFGVQASPSWSWLSTNDNKLEGVSSNWGVKLGVLGEYYFAENYAIASGLGFGFNQGGSIQNGYARYKPWDESNLLDEIPSDVFAPDTKLHYRHGGKGEGNASLNTPRLAGQSDAYLTTQFAHFKQGLRGYDQQDRFGRQMKLMANTLDDAQLKDVLAYLNTLDGK